MKQILTAILAVTLTLTLLSACKDNANQQNSSQNVSQTSSENNTNSNTDHTQHYPVTIQTHNYAKEKIEQTFEKAPERVICYSLNSVENMIALGLEDRIVLAMGISKDEVLPEYQSAVDKIDRVQQEFIGKEEAIALQADFILAWYSSFDDTRLGDVDFWQERGTNTYMAYNSGLGDQNLQNEFDDILNLGKIFDVEEKAKALVAQMQKKVKQAQAYVQGKEPVNIVILEDEGDVFRIYGEDTIGGDIAVQVGANLVAKTRKEKKSAEELVQLNPEMIFAIHFGENSESLNDKNCMDVFQHNPVYQNIDAVKNQKMYPTDLSLVYCPGVRVGVAIDFFLEHLYPDLTIG